MKRITISLASLLVAAGMTIMPAQAQSLLEGLIGGSDGGGLVNIGSGEAANSGLVSVGLGGGGGNVLDVNVGSGSSGPLANANVGTGSGNSLDAKVGVGGSSNRILDTNVSVGGGSGRVLDANVGVGGPRGLGVGVNVGLGGGSGQPGMPGNPGNNGNNGANGNNGNNGGNGRNVIIYRNGGGGVMTTAPVTGNASSKVKMIARILENRAWLRFANGKGVCLPGAGVASISGWVPQSQYGHLNKVLDTYSSDIGTLRKLLANCRGGQGVGRGDIARAVGVDLREDGSVVLFVL